MAGLLGATVVAAAGPLLVYLYPPPDPKQRPQKLRVSLPQALDTIAEGEAIGFTAPVAAAFVMIDGGGTNGPGQPTFGGFLTRHRGSIRAFASTCPHLGCNYAYDAGAHRFECPCHGSRFDLEGRVLRGPAANPLSHLSWAPAESATEIVVDGVSMPA